MRIQRGAKPALYAHSGRTSPLFVTRAQALPVEKSKGIQQARIFKIKFIFLRS